MFRTEQIASSFHSVLAKAPLRMRLALAATAVVGSAQMAQAQVPFPNWAPADADPPARQVAQQTPSGSVLDRVMEGLSDPQPETRYNAARALSGMSNLVNGLDPESRDRFAHDVVERYIHEQDPQVRVRMARTIYILEPDLSTLDVALHSPKVAARLHTVQYLAVLADTVPGAAALLRRVAQEDPDERARNAAAQALQGTDEASAQNRPQSSMPEPDRDSGNGLGSVSREDLLHEFDRLMILKTRLIGAPGSLDRGTAVFAQSVAVDNQIEAIKQELSRRPLPELDMHDPATLRALAAQNEATTKANASFHNAQQSVNDSNRRMREWDKEMKYQEMSHRHE